MNLSQQVVEVGLCLLEAGLTDGSSGNISARCPEGQAMLITPSARDYRLITERDLVRVHLDSGKAEGRWKPSSEWRLHTAVYQIRPDVHAIIHHHGSWASAVAVARKTIPVLLDEAADLGPIRTASYAPSGSPELAQNVSEQLAGGGHAVLLANHGALVVGGDLPEALRRALEVERVTKIYLGAELLGGAFPLDEAAVGHGKKFLETYRTASAEHRGLVTTAPRIVGPVQLQDLISYSFRVGVTFASLLHALILQKLHARPGPA